MSQDKPVRNDLLGTVFSGLLSLNWITQFGATMTTVSVFLIAFFVSLGLMGIIHTAYMGLIAFVVLPVFFLIGLILMPVGVWVSRRRKASGKDPRVITLDLGNWDTRRAILLLFVLTLVNLNIVSAVAYKGYQYTESVEFCGTTCHTVMGPVFSAYQHSPHSNVKCADCHIGGGTSSFLLAKITGVRQLFAAVRHTYQTPTPTPVESLRPAREICEECHRPDQFAGDRLRTLGKQVVDDDACAFAGQFKADLPAHALAPASHQCHLGFESEFHESCPWM